MPTFALGFYVQLPPNNFFHVRTVSEFRPLSGDRTNQFGGRDFPPSTDVTLHLPEYQSLTVSRSSKV